MAVLPAGMFEHTRSEHHDADALQQWLQQCISRQGMADETPLKGITPIRL